MSEEERLSSQDLLDTSASDIWINIKLIWLSLAVLLCLNLAVIF